MILTGGEKINKVIIKKYSIPLKKTFDLIEKKNGVSRSVRKLWTPNERKLWTLRLKKCPICQEKWTKDNPMTKEHIHPLVLGGDESTVNIIPLCKKCNTSRNHVMYVSLGTEKIKQIRKRMPLIKKQVENFIIWAHASIYLDQEALLEYQDLTKEFEKDRGIENLFNDTKNQTPKNEDRSIWTKMKKYLHPFSTNSSNKFGIYNTIQSVEVKKDKPEKIIIGKKAEHTRASLKIPNVLEQKESHDDNNNECVDKAKFIHIIDKLIADDKEISVTAIGQRIRRMQQHDNWQELGTRSFLKHHGFTGNYGLLNALKLCFGEQILVESQRIKFIHKNIVSEKGNENKIVSKKISKTREQKENTDKNPKNIDLNKEKFKQEIKQLLTDDDEISVTVIGHRIRKMQEQNKWNELGTRSFLRHHGFTGNFGLLNALKLCFGDEIEVEENKNALRIKILREKTNEDDLISNDITLFLKEKFSKRLLTKTFQDGVTASQIAYVVKLAKDNFKLSWTKLFKPFNVEGTVQQKSVSLVTLLGFIIEEGKNEDGKIIYKISESTN